MARDRNDQQLLAHSPSKGGMPGDPYQRHVNGVRCGARERAEAMLRYASNLPLGILESIEAAAIFHDLGKLDPEIQAVFRKGRGHSLRWDHIDAGVAYLSHEQNWMAAWLARAHHSPGLPEWADQFVDGRRLRGRRRDDETKERYDEQIEHTDLMIKLYLSLHEAIVGPYAVQRRCPIHGLAMRLALSCLVDADHADSAFYDTGRLAPAAPNQRWDERLNALCEYVRSLPVGETDAERARNQRRSDFFEGCLRSEINDPLVACEASVGLGKTTAVTAYLMRRALDEKKLRRLIIVAPFTNILTQIADRLRKALVLPGEQPDQVIIEHHHRADFSHRDDRELAVLWGAPIVLTTAVSFFETLAACDPASLRKLHAVPGSAIFLDEAHAALPTRLWPQNWKWMRELAEQWGCRIVLASGSLVRFWEHHDIVDGPMKLPELMPSDQLQGVVHDEQRRVKFAEAASGRVLKVNELIGLVKNAPGPRLVILNTVQNAAIVAKAMRDSGLDVLHLSTALTAHDRKIILARIERRLLFDFGDWTLVATSCVEAGVDLSFRCAFRERFAAASTIQVGGRVNRHGEYSEHGGGIVYDFALADEGITQHPAADVSADVLRELLVEGKLNRDNPADLVTLAMREELKRNGGLPSDLLVKAESERDYPKAKELARVIDADTRFVVIDPHLKELLRKHIPVDFRALLEGSVQVWAHKIEKLGLERLHGHRDIYAWNDTYDPDFLGYMSAVLRNEEFLRDKEAWIV